MMRMIINSKIETNPSTSINQLKNSLKVLGDLIFRISDLKGKNPEREQVESKTAIASLENVYPALSKIYR